MLMMMISALGWTIIILMARQDRFSHCQWWLLVMLHSSWWLIVVNNFLDMDMRGQKHITRQLDNKSTSAFQKKGTLSNHVYDVNKTGQDFDPQSHGMTMTKVTCLMEVCLFLSFSTYSYKNRICKLDSPNGFAERKKKLFAAASPMVWLVVQGNNHGH